jgi:hypothetical protein
MLKHTMIDHFLGDGVMGITNVNAM